MPLLFLLASLDRAPVAAIDPASAKADGPNVGWIRAGSPKTAVLR